MNTIGSQIKAARIAMQLSQKKLSELSGIRAATICELENNKSNCTLETACKVLDALEMRMVAVRW